MHELPVVRSILDKASAYALEHKATGVKAISLVVGEGTGYVPESIQMYFDVLSAGTACEGAQIQVRIVKPVLLCGSCGGRYERKPFAFECPVCGGEGSPTETGKELYIEDIEFYTDKGESTDEGNDQGAGDGGNPQ